MKRQAWRWIMLAPVLGSAALLVYGYGTVPAFTEVQTAYRPSDVYVLDRQGVPLSALRTDSKVRRLSWTPLNDVAPTLLRSVISAEDRRFYSHSGVDVYGLGSGLIGLVRGAARGGSTISMQVAGLLDNQLAPKGVQRSFGQKIRQILAARKLERTWSKVEILEAYLNLAQFRGELQGVRTASRGLFNKEPSGLDEDEALLLTGLLKSPNAYPTQLARRACQLAGRPWQDYACDRLKTQAVIALAGSHQILSSTNDAPHIARLLLKSSRNSLPSTLDADTQRFALEAVKRHLTQLVDHHVQDGAVLVVDNQSGEVIAYVGNSGETSSASYVDGVQALRQAGSTLKPFLYGLAIENRLLTAASFIEDTPLNIATQNGVYHPQNYDHSYQGLVTVRSSLASSLNIPAVRTLMLVGPNAFADRLRQLGFSNIHEDGDYYGHSLALGTGDVSLWQLVNAYRAIANDGEYSAMQFKAQKTHSSSSVMDAGAAFIIADILSDTVARSRTFGLDSVLATPYFTAVKTGTSKDMRDNWCIGFSERYTVGVWVGNFDGSPMWDVSGISGAAPIWLEVMNKLHQHQNSLPPQAPATVATSLVRFSPAVEPERHEWFLNGTDTSLVQIKQASNVEPHIVYPTPGVTIALDPDIPTGHQRLFFRVQPQNLALKLKLDGRQVVDSWQLQSGNHTLVLESATGKQYDRIQFAVKGSFKNGN